MFIKYNILGGDIMKTFAENKWGNCKNAVAYTIRFTGITYGYDCDGFYDYHKSMCPYCNYNEIQTRDYEYPRSIFSKKDFVFLDTYEYAVSPKIYNDMLEFGISPDNFRPIYNRNQKELLGYQLTPSKRLSDNREINGYIAVAQCEHCGTKYYELASDISHIDAYKGYGYPTYIDENTLSELKHIAYVLNNEVIISLELYNYLIEKYPKFQCCPVFIGDIRQDREYIRLHDTTEKHDNKMKSYTLLLHISKHGDMKKIGAFETEKIPNIIKEYSRYDGFNECGGRFLADKSCYIDPKLQNRVYCYFVWLKKDIGYDVDECDLDEYEPSFYGVFRNEATAKEKFAKLLAEKSLNLKDLYFDISDSIIDTKYWVGGYDRYDY